MYVYMKNDRQILNIWFNNLHKARLEIGEVLVTSQNEAHFNKINVSNFKKALRTDFSLNIFLINLEVSLLFQESKNINYSIKKTILELFLFGYEYHIFMVEQDDFFSNKFLNYFSKMKLKQVYLANTVTLFRYRTFINKDIISSLTDEYYVVEVERGKKTYYIAVLKKSIKEDLLSIYIKRGVGLDFKSSPLESLQSYLDISRSKLTFSSKKTPTINNFDVEDERKKTYL